MADLTLIPSKPNSSASALTSPAPTPPKRIYLSARDMRVVALHKAGFEESEIASRLKTDVIRVQASLLKFYQKQLAGSFDLVAIRTNEMAIDNLGLVNQMISDGLQATKPVFDDKGNEIRREPDIATRKSMAVLLKDWFQAVVPKTPLISQSINQNNQQNNFGIGGGRARSFESLVREAEERHKLEAAMLASPKTIDAEVLPDADGDADDETNSEIEDGEDEIEDGEVIAPELDDADSVDEEED